MIKWIDPKLRLPPQGKKILYFDRGDVYVVQRFADMWLPIPFTEKKYDFIEPPELWSDIELPGNYTGYMKVGIEEEDDLMTVDDFQRKYPEDYKSFILSWREFIGRKNEQETT